MSCLGPSKWAVISAAVAGARRPQPACAGAAWADQALNWRLYRNQPATAVVLLGVTAQFILLGLLPLLDTFFVAPAFLAGLACGCVVMRRQRRHAPGRCCWAFWQVRRALLTSSIQGGVLGMCMAQPALPSACASHTCVVGSMEHQTVGGSPGCPGSSCGAQVLCATAVAGALAVGAYGVLQGAQLGQQCTWCQRVACVPTDWWTCSGTSTAGRPACTFSPLPNATGRIDCPSARLPLLLPRVC